MAAQDVLATSLATPLATAARRRRGPVLLVATGLLLVLAAAAAAVLVLREQDQHADAVARGRLAGAAVSVSAVGVASDHRVAVVLSVTSGTSARIVGAHVTGDGWQAVHDRAVGLVSSVDCTAAPALPTSADAVLVLHGQHREVDLLADPGVLDVLRRTGREACGDVDARRALTARAGATTRVAAGLRIPLAITNHSAHPVTVQGIQVGGLHVAGGRVPMVLAPRTTVRLLLLLDARGCGRSAPLVELLVTGRGGPSRLTVASADLPQLAVRLRDERCR